MHIFVKVKLFTKNYYYAITLKEAAKSAGII